MSQTLEPSSSSTSAPSRAALHAAQDRFISIWGQMGSTWGIPRTMAEVHALLFIAGEPLTADEVIERLRISRGNASMMLRALVDWGIVTRVRQRGDRKESFVAEQDVSKLFRTILRERKKREFDPLLEALHDCREMTTTRPRRALDPAAAASAAHNARLDEMLRFMHTIDALSQRFISPSGKGLHMAAKLLAKVI